MLEIFKNDAFGVTSLTDALKDVRFVSGRLGDIGLFSTHSVTTLTVAIERVGDLIQIVTPTPRGAPGEVREQPRRSMTNLAIPHFQRDWSVIADEVQSLRQFGSEQALATVQNLVATKIGATVVDLDVTDEFSRLGAVQGIITYKGGQTLNLFTEFGISQPAEIDFDLDAASPAAGILRKRCTDVIRAMRKTLGGIPFEYVRALVGDNFFDDLLRHPEVRETYKGWSEAKVLRESYVGKDRGSNPTFEFGGIVWENYGAIDDSGDGALIGIGTDVAKFFPVGVPGLFKTYHAPADYVETVNTPGQRLYAKQWEFANGKGVHGETQSNVLHICTRPGALLRGKRT